MPSLREQVRQRHLLESRSNSAICKKAGEAEPSAREQVRPYFLKPGFDSFTFTHLEGEEEDDPLVELVMMVLAITQG